MKHLLLLSPGFAADEDDSRCIPPLQLFVKELQSRGLYKISILSLHYPYRTGISTWNGVSHYSCFKKGPFQKVRIMRQAAKYIQRIHKETPIDGLHSFWINDAALIGQRFSKTLSVPHWITMMGQDVRPSNRYLRLLSVRQLQTIALSQYHDDVFFKTCNRNADTIIPWGINPSNYTLDESTRDIDILGVGNQIPLKNYTLFIRLIARLKDHFPQLKAVLIGDGVERKKLEQQAITAGLTANLKFTGYIPRQEVLQTMKRSKVFLHTSTYESFGYVFLEALAAGQQIVSTPVGLAADAAYCSCAETEDALLSLLREQLKSTTNASPAFPLTISATVDQYLDIYKSSL